MKAYRLALVEKNSNGKINRIYTVAENESEATKYFEDNFSRFNNLFAVVDVSNTKKGKALLAK